jgi:hypothetical protein
MNRCSVWAVTGCVPPRDGFGGWKSIERKQKREKAAVSKPLTRSEEPVKSSRAWQRGRARHL